MSNTVAVKSWSGQILPVMTMHGGPPCMQSFPVASSQTIATGDPIALNTSTGEISLGTTSSTTIEGVAAEPVVTTADDEKTQCLVWLADPETVFQVQADAASNTVHEGGTCGLGGSSGAWKADIGDDNSTTIMRVVEKTPGDDETDATNPGRVRFIWNATKIGRGTP